MKDNNKVVPKTRFIVKDIQDEFYTKWCGKLIDANPKFQDGKPVFVIVSSQSRQEFYTCDLKYLEKRAQEMTQPKGRQAITKDTARIYIKEEDNNEKLIAVVFHTRSKTYVPVRQKVSSFIDF